MIRFLGVGLIFITALCSATASDKEETRKLVEEVNATSSASLIGPYQISARLLINPHTKEEKTAEWKFFRDATRYRVELRIGGYQEIQVRDGNKLFIRRTPGVFPSPGLGQLTHPEQLWQVWAPPGSSLSGVSGKQAGAALCFSVKPKGYSANTHYCVSSQNKTIISHKNSSQIVELGKYLQLGAGYLPGTIEIRDSEPKRHIIFEDLRAQQLSPAAETFTAPEQARQFETCEYPKSAESIHRVEPTLPGNSAGTATIFLHGLIQKDGSISDLQVFSPEGPALEESGRNAASQWKFSPATCDGHPIASEMEIVVTLSRN